MTKPFRLLLFIACMLSGAARAWAHSPDSAALAGVITTQQLPVSGATITIFSSSLQEPRTVVTSELGTYRFNEIPPGQYTVVIRSQTSEAVRLINAGAEQTSRLDLDLEPVPHTHANEVTGGIPPLTKSTQISANFPYKMIVELPIARTIRETVLLAPGVTPGGPGRAIVISGSPSADSVYLVNGVVVNENLRGQPHDLFIEDAVAETTVLTGGISAEYGRFTGGVVSTLTKSGGNGFDGSFRDSLQNPSWSSELPDAPEGSRPDLIRSTYEATLGGFLRRDRLWFFTAGRTYEGPAWGAATTTRQTVDGSHYENTIAQTRLEGKLTAIPTPQHTVVGSYIDINAVEANNSFGMIYDKESLVTTRSLPSSLMSVNYTGMLHENFFAEAQFSRKKFQFVGGGGRDTDRIAGTWVQELNSGARLNSPVFCGVCTDEERNNESWTLKGTSYIRTARMGTHSILLGAENFMEERLANNYESASAFNVSTATIQVLNGRATPSFDSSTRIGYKPILEPSQGTDLETLSFFINDKWDWSSHLSFSLGVRFDQTNARDASNNPVSNDSALSPRLGAIYDLGGNGRNRVNLSYGKYVSKIMDGNVASGAQVAGNPATFEWTYTGPVINADGSMTTHEALRELFAWFDLIGGTSNRSNLIFATVPGYDVQLNGSLKAPSVNEYTVGFLTQPTPDSFAKIDVISREWQDFYAYRLDGTTGQTTDPFGNRSDLALIENDDTTVREYRGVQLQFGWRPSKFNLGGAYTWSTLRGNDEGEAPATGTSPNMPLSLYYPEYLGYEQRSPVGYLSGDQRHRARIWASYDLATRAGQFNFSLLQSYDSGRAYSAIGSIDPVKAPGAPRDLGYTLSQMAASHPYYFSERGAYRSDDVYSTDLALNYSLPVLRSVQIFAQAEVINSLNDQTVIPPWAGVRTFDSNGASSGLQAFNPFTTAPIECPQGAAAATCSSMGAHWQKSPSFGEKTPDSYQSPRTFRVSAGFRF